MRSEAEKIEERLSAESAGLQFCSLMTIFNEQSIYFIATIFALFCICLSLSAWMEARGQGLFG